MTFSNSDNSRNVIKYTGQNYQFTPAYARNRDPTTNDIRDPKNQGYYPFTALWINKTNSNLWALVKIANNLATWILLSAGGVGPSVQFPVPNGTSPVVADAGGNVTLTSTANTVTITGGLNTINFDLTNGAPLDKIGVDASTPPGTNPVLPSGTGQINITGGQVATGTIGANVIRTNSVAVNAFKIEIQRSTAVAATDSTKNGVSHYSNAQFAVDANGFVTLAGGTGPAIQSLTGDDALPIVPTAGNINLTGVTVASATHAKPLFFVKNATSTEELDIQLSTAITVPANSNLAGISSFDTASFAVNTNGWVTAKSGITPGVSNLGIAYSAGTFTIQGANGTALSATNPAYVTLQDGTTPGRLITVPITANQTFTDGAGNIDTWRGGVSPTTATGGASSNWSNDMPIFLYAVLGTTNDIAFMFSRDSALVISTTAAHISKTGTILNVDQTDMFSLLGGTIANYASRPALLVGSFRMQNIVNAGTIRYTVQALNSTDGIGEYQEQTIFTFPSGTQGSKVGTYVQQNAGTNVVFGTNRMFYTINRAGFVYYKFDGVNATAGVGAQAFQPTLPYTPEPTEAQVVGQIAAQFRGATGNIDAILIGGASTATFLNTIVATGTSVNYTNASIANGDAFQFQFFYKAF